jgi:hypothetical protein
VNVLVIPRTSVVVRLAVMYGGMKLPTNRRVDVCNLRVNAMLGVLKAFFYTLTVALGLVLCGTGDVIAWFVAMLSTWTWITPTNQTVDFLAGIGLCFMVLFTCAGGYGFAHLLDTSPKLPTYKKPSALRLAYRSWREKTCHLVFIE